MGDVRTRGAWLCAGLVVVGLAASGCSLPPWGRPAPEPVPAVAVAEAPPVVTVSALLSYRLIINPALADAPSRLLVLHTRIEALDEGSFRFDPAGAQIQLPDGTIGRAFDQARALELLQRTDLGLGDLAYLERGGGGLPRGGLNAPLKPVLTNLVRKELLGRTDFSREQPLQGYLVVDIGRPLASLQGVVLEVEAVRLSDAAPVRDRYEFASSGVQNPIP